MRASPQSGVVGFASRVCHGIEVETKGPLEAESKASISFYGTLSRLCARASGKLYRLARAMRLTRSCPSPDTPPAQDKLQHHPNSPLVGTP